MSQCYNLFGSQIWLLDSNSITGLGKAWLNVIRKLWCQTNTPQSDIEPYLVSAPPLEELFRKIAKMYNDIRKCFNCKMLLFLRMSVCADKMGIAAVNFKIISSRWSCGFEHVQCNLFGHPKAAIRDFATKELMDTNLFGFSTDEIKVILVDIACYKV